jgi:exosortase
VPPLALGLAWRRWHWLMEIAPLPLENRRVPFWFGGTTLVTLIALFPLRIVLVADPTWRPPLLLFVLIVVLMTHGWLWVYASRRFSIGMLPVTIFALSAVPYPWHFEKEVIGMLTDWVVGFTHEMFLLAGRPVEVAGGMLSLGGDQVEVNEGCSGIRSFQSLVMVALFFGELLLLPMFQRVALILAAAGCAVGINTLRAYWLAAIHFDKGKAAAAAAHDGIGHAAFVSSALLLYLTALLLLRLSQRQKRVIRRIQVGGSQF